MLEAPGSAGLAMLGANPLPITWFNWPGIRIALRFSLGMKVECILVVCAVLLNKAWYSVMPGSDTAAMWCEWPSMPQAPCKRMGWWCGQTHTVQGVTADALSLDG